MSSTSSAAKRYATHGAMKASAEQASLQPASLQGLLLTECHSPSQGAVDVDLHSCLSTAPEHSNKKGKANLAATVAHPTRWADSTLSSEPSPT